MVATRTALLAATGLALVMLCSGSSVNALPLFSDHTGPDQARITSFERLDAGCADVVATSAHGSLSGGTYTKTTTIDAATLNDSLSASVDRFSRAGADLSTFAVRVATHPAGAASAGCDVVVQYRIELTLSGGSPAGLLPDSHGFRIFWFENGEPSGCSASVTSPLPGCPGVDSVPHGRVWANATD